MGTGRGIYRQQSERRWLGIEAGRFPSDIALIRAQCRDPSHSAQDDGFTGRLHPFGEMLPDAELDREWFVLLVRESGRDVDGDRLVAG